MSSSPGYNPPSWNGQTPVDQPPMQSNSPAISYTGSFGQPSNSFAGMGKSPQVSPPMQQQAPQQQMQQPMPQQQAPMQQGQSHYGRLGQFGGQDGAADPMYMAMMGRPEAQQRYNEQINSRPNIWG